MCAGKQKGQVISLLNIEKLYSNKDIDEQMYVLFHGHCHRIMRKPYGIQLPFSDETLLHMKDSFFWSELIKEILNLKACSESELANELNCETSFIRQVIAREKYNFEMPLQIGTCLLKKHSNMVSLFSAKEEYK